MCVIYVVLLDAYERFHIRYFRRKAVEECVTQITADDKFTHCISIGPVSKHTQTNKQTNTLLLYTRLGVYISYFSDIKGDTNASKMAP